MSHYMCVGEGRSQLRSLPGGCLCTAHISMTLVLRKDVPFLHVLEDLPRHGRYELEPLKYHLGVPLGFKRVPPKPVTAPLWWGPGGKRCHGSGQFLVLTTRSCNTTFYLWPEIWVQVSTSSHTWGSGMSSKQPSGVL